MPLRRIILCNLRLAVSIARDYIGLGLTLDDLVSEGSIGLMKAATKFDPFHRVRFATYASFWVRHTILRALYSQNRVIRLPAHVVARLLKVKQVLERMTAELGREPNGRNWRPRPGCARRRSPICWPPVPFRFLSMLPMGRITVPWKISLSMNKPLTPLFARRIKTSPRNCTGCWNPASSSPNVNKSF